MKTRFLVIFLGLASGIAWQGLAQWQDTTDPRVARLLVGFYDSALRTKYDYAFNEKDSRALAALFTEDALLVAPEGLFSGRRTIEKRYADLFQRSQLTSLFGVRDHLNAIGNELWAAGKWWALVQSDKGPVQVGGYWAEIYVQEEGAWKIRLSIFNVSPQEDSSAPDLRAANLSPDSSQLRPAPASEF
jgi:uncharacterized protein (TIGR02246 family)